ncbi:uncharacterized protein LOC112269435 [Brachypodium distachyon]|uniref:Uncharacterized protein n=1 Tax=Brachypodium distachyon TaxID=15368 RepID=A0A2K2CFF3_BRADI|nr:uncharacterized protein LOC112269435 [Brachypodium distachyon]PNT60753.1 hypothetical protein BRADI_5g03978v3 [Brachypodium distachyon]|eukprot:XP_024311958.1 uncharacterized protein LOC112269435 [Brachypodium distachyon]
MKRTHGADDAVAVVKEAAVVTDPVEEEEEAVIVAGVAEEKEGVTALVKEAAIVTDPVEEEEEAVIVADAAEEKEGVTALGKAPAGSVTSSPSEIAARSNTRQQEEDVVGVVDPINLSHDWDFSDDSADYTEFDEVLSDLEPEEKDSDVGSEEESIDAKSRHVLNALEYGAYEYRYGDKWVCLFCHKWSLAEYFKSMVKHGEDTGHVSKKAPHIVAKHKAFGVFLRKLEAQEVDADAEPSKKKARRGRKKGRK